MNSDRAVSLMKERADTIILARARMAAQMGILFPLGGETALRQVFEAELERIRGANDNAGWIG